MSAPATATKRLQKEFNELTNTNPLPWVKVNLVDDKITRWKATINGPDRTPYEKGVFNIDIDIPNEYPFKPPKILFLTKIYHPNVKSDGNVCMNIIQEGWSPQHKISDILNTLKTTLTTPDPDHPLENDIAQLFKTDPNKFNKTAKEWTNKYAK